MDFCGVSKSDTPRVGGRQTSMAQPHKGPRRLTQARIPERAFAEVHRRATDAGVSISQYIADVMCLHVGMAEEARELVAEPSLISRHEAKEGRLADIA